MRSLLLIVFCFFAAGCEYRGSPAAGKILEVTNVDAATESWEFRPIAGAEVLVLWYGYKSAFAHGRSVCLAKTYARSHTDGSFRVEGWRMPRVVSGVTDIRPVSYVYMPGFSDIRDQNQWHPIMKRPSPNDPAVYVLRRADGPLDPAGRENAFVNARFCPSEGFAGANITMEPTR